MGDYKHSTCADFFKQLKKKPSSVALIPLNFRGKRIGSLNMGSYSSNRFVSSMATDFLEHMISIISLCFENSLNIEMMRRTSFVDTLTGVNNRLFLEQRIEEELDSSHP